MKTEEIVMGDSHDRKKMLYEYRAKNTLKFIYPNEFDHLVKSEKPDWKDETKSIGVEVVRATDASALAGRNNFLKISGKNISSVSAKDIESVTKYGGNLYIDPATNNLMVLGSLSPNTEKERCVRHYEKSTDSIGNPTKTRTGNTVPV